MGVLFLKAKMSFLTPQPQVLNRETVRTLTHTYKHLHKHKNAHSHSLLFMLDLQASMRKKRFVKTQKGMNKASQELTLLVIQ